MKQQLRVRGESADNCRNEEVAALHRETFARWFGSDPCGKWVSLPPRLSYNVSIDQRDD